MTPVASVIIPAHNEAEVIERCLDALFTGVEPGEFEVIVACNGCSDETAALARASGHPVQVLELKAASKAAALRAGDLAAQTLPRLYLDADVVMSGGSARKVAERLTSGTIAARPPVLYSSADCSASVRSYFRARSRMPSLLQALWGAGVYGLSAAGRARFAEFPDIGADDLWVNLLFDPEEVEIVDCAPVVVAVPRRARDLLHVLRRTYKGKAENGVGFSGENAARETTMTTLRDLRRVAASGPTSAIDAATYAAFAARARLGLALGTAVGTTVAAERWERDESSRRAAA
jgi:glycosyltransferase involved in cell wall biosynthesis